MKRYLSLKWMLALTILAAALAFPLAAFAGGVTVTVDKLPGSPVAGSAYTIGFAIHSMHDGSAQSDFSPTVTATNAASGDKITVTAVRAGPAGHYEATLTLPSAGTWNWEIQPLGRYAENYPASVMTPLEVRAAGASSGTSVQPAAAAAAGPDLGRWVAAVVLLGVVALVVLADRRRRATARA